jgi:hypothetical protein
MARVSVRLELSSQYARAYAGITVAPHVMETARMIKNRSQMQAPVRTGNLRASGYVKPQVKPTEVSAEVGYRAKYSRMVHGGTKPHIIRAVHARALAFDWPKVGGKTLVPIRPMGFTGHTRLGVFIIGKGYVNHPGTRARPFLTTAMTQVGVARGYSIRFESVLH